MSGSQSLTAIDASQYELIEATMAESARGRWFLQEYARRNRTADTEMLLGAIERLEGVVVAQRAAAPETERVERVRHDLMDMADAIARTKLEVAAIDSPDAAHGRLGLALDAIVLATERATSDILAAAEHVQEVAWTLRESGSETAVCDELDRMATQIYTACSFQDLTAQRTARIVHTLRYLEERLGVMMAIWGDEATPPAAEDALGPEVLCQNDVDRFIDTDAFAASLAVASPPADRKPERPAFDALDDAIAFEEAPAVVEAVAGAASEEAAPDVGVAPSRDDLGAWDEAAIQDDPAPEPDAEVAPAGGTAPGKTDIETAFADIDGLTDEEKAALFS
ncbi:hypothetical protein ASG40_12140 [Methylobacterium sp. Leaf399]|uniref:hypothetical protein n=1 Tax=Methylobacterium sp. Leaf399 TaxID=1736364 RepID=UPI0007009E45|nr:hypothetical protein [Methylobacterium sp. Leaf399]KQT08617.1 hypothetical protein ASG40_12140 [Methylobacterium sp. Leaf399]